MAHAGRKCFLVFARDLEFGAWAFLGVNSIHSRLFLGEEEFCMEYEEDLKKLESNVEKMLNNLDSAQGDKVKLQADVLRLEQEKKGLEEQVKRLKEEKKSIHQRVSGLLGAIEKWEKSAGHPVDPVSSASALAKGASEPVQGVLIGN